MHRYGVDIVKNLIKVRVADITAQNPKYLLKRLNKIFFVKSILEDILNNKECFSRKDLDINGNDLIDLGFRGKEIGEILNSCLKSVIDGETLNINYELTQFVLDNYFMEE